MTADSIGLEKKSSRNTGPAIAQMPSPAGIAMREASRSADATLRSSALRSRTAHAADTAGSRLTPIVVVSEGTRL